MITSSSDSAVDSGKRGARTSSHTEAAPSRATLLALPAELRLLIWHTYCTWPNKPSLRWATDVDREAGPTLVEAGLLFTCKQIYAELWPILTANVQLHITYPNHSPEEPLQFPPPHVCEWIRSMVFHSWVGLSGLDVDDIPPKTSIRFRRFRNLKTFTLCKPIWVRVSELLAEDGITRMTQETYETSSEEEKLAAWGALTWMSAGAIIGMVTWDRGSWVSRVLGPEYRPQIHDSDSDGDNEDAGEDSEEDEAMELEVINKLHPILEAELYLFEGSGYAPLLIQTLLVSIDIRAKKIIESRLLSKEEMGKRLEEGQ
ncbi:hypothetical protein DL766_004273 [Monosporascus sp. MC13-8B]|uniref:Transcription factor domain-containing protein n=1 Tax=Monosporascus cannonballus TaxID=155416 RepID=A0ABY0HAE0_9PEZI|nr:hypothetical protein DL762_003489 [Monosporascus cannonballus]RYO98575.1 hypothetical protein DL763_002105 [Monosporascus cannonballus]RYP31731.1 hypothetical protein DL766_004273 [Monosporascus sp. MC13-8B]